MQNLSITTVLLSLGMLFVQEANSQLYDFNIKTPQSGLSGSLALTADTAGTLIGNYDQTNNPSGTRTKPGLFGSFGSTENVPVNIRIDGQIGGNLSTNTTGSFRMGIDLNTNTLTITDYFADFLSATPENLPATVTLSGDPFRTRNPDSIYPLLIPITLPIGNVLLSEFNATQVGAGAGTLTPIGGNQYNFVAAIAVNLTFAVDLLGTPLGNTFPFVLPLEGLMTLNGTEAHLNSVRPLNFDQSTSPGITLPGFEFGLPTILPPGGTANVIFNLTLDEIGSNADLQLTTVANGSLVPEPSSLMLLGAGMLGFLRRWRGR
jgi:hypothetical protein